MKLYYKATVIKTVQQWHKNRHIDQWNRIKSPEINTCLYGLLILTKEASPCNGVGKIVYSINAIGKIGQICAKSETDHLLTTYICIKSKRIKDLNVRVKTIKILVENIGSKIFSISGSNNFSDISPRVRETSKQTNKQANKKQQDCRGDWRGR